MSIATIQQQLSTPPGFAKAVKSTSSTLVAGLISLAAAVFCLGMNTFQLGSASDWNWRLIERYFLTADVIEFTGSRSGRAEIWRFLYVYAPIVLIPLGIILLIVHFSTRSRNGRTLFEDFQSRGWVGRQRYTGMKAQNGRAQVEVVFISHPSIPDETFDATVQQYSAWVASLDKKSLKKTIAAVTKAGALTGLSAAVLSPELPAAITVATVRGSSEFAAVVPPGPDGKGKYRVLEIKHEAA
ncbi:hypothetical protein GCM10027421_20610 [Microbacterium shaanxiense]